MLGVIEEELDRLGGFFRVQLKGDLAQVGGHFNGRGGPGGQRNEQAGGQQRESLEHQAVPS
ncbi:hypothetical protein SDC9_202453 [bioreactor metagenome]|uniref:Uncharacterized protein n=1 Tax=bioreactor metagenome TaxID=1076179 RepID=A0A645IUD9_9ZZZZ